VDGIGKVEKKSIPDENRKKEFFPKSNKKRKGKQKNIKELEYSWVSQLQSCSHQALWRNS
jgi:hypothetical protein